MTSEIKGLATLHGGTFAAFRIEAVEYDESGPTTRALLVRRACEPNLDAVNQILAFYRWHVIGDWKYVDEWSQHYYQAEVAPDDDRPGVNQVTDEFLDLRRQHKDGGTR